MTVLNEAGNEGSEGDDTGRWGQRQRENGRIGKVEFGVEVDEVVVEERWDVG